MRDTTAYGGKYHVRVKDFYRGNKKSPYLSSLNFELSKQEEVPREDADKDIKSDLPFHPIKVKGISSQCKKKRKMGEGEIIRETEKDDKDDNDTPLPSS